MKCSKVKTAEIKYTGLETWSQKQKKKWRIACNTKYSTIRVTSLNLRQLGDNSLFSSSFSQLLWSFLLSFQPSYFIFVILEFRYLHLSHSPRPVCAGGVRIVASCLILAAFRRTKFHDTSLPWLTRSNGFHSKFRAGQQYVWYCQPRRAEPRPIHSEIQQYQGVRRPTTVGQPCWWWAAVCLALFH